MLITGRNVNDIYGQAREMLLRIGRPEESRAGTVLVAPHPVLTSYERPTERVLLDPRRDANPFFHLFESLWLLAGRDDARWLDWFVSDFSARFAEQPEGVLHGSYGKRWRGWFAFDDEEDNAGAHGPFGDEGTFDQLEMAVAVLKEQPGSRQVVVTMWDPGADYGFQELRDRPCNTQVYLRIREEAYREPAVNDQNSAEWEARIAREGTRVLDLTVTCRSNDIVWGAYGANAVQFSVLQEYLAGRMGVGVGRMYQFSNNWHGYTAVTDKMGWTGDDPYARGLVSPVPMGTHWDHWDTDLATFMRWTEARGTMTYTNSWFREVAEPMFLVHQMWRQGTAPEALQLALASIAAPDWQAAARLWLSRRATK